MNMKARVNLLRAKYYFPTWDYLVYNVDKMILIATDVMVLITGNDALVILQGNVAMRLLVICWVLFNVFCSIVVFIVTVGIREFVTVGFKIFIMRTLVLFAAGSYYFLLCCVFLL